VRACRRGNRHTGLYVATQRLTRRNHDDHNKKTQGAQQVTASKNYPRPRRPTIIFNNKRHTGLGTVRTQKEESMVVGLLFLHRKAGRLILVLCSGEREGQIGSWPTAQAETSNPLRCVARVETLPLKGPRLLIRHWILDAEKHTDNILRLLKVSTSLPTQADHTNAIPPSTTKSGTIMTSTGDASQEDSNIDQPLLRPEDINQDQLLH
jgi:hypothetical protein